METEYTPIFNDSFQRCTGDPDFLNRFYRIFLSSSEEVKAKFSHTDMQLQKKIMLKSLAYRVHANINLASIHKTAINHDKHHLNITPAPELAPTLQLKLVSCTKGYPYSTV